MAKAVIKSNEGSDGKLIDTWHYEYKGLTEESRVTEEEPDKKPRRFVEAKKVAIELRLIKNYTGSTPPLAVKDVEFLLVCKDLDIRLRGNGIETLRAAMWEKLDEKFSVTWEFYYLVRVEPALVYRGIGTGIAFTREYVEKGTAWDGTLLLKDLRDSRDPIISPWPGTFRDKGGKVLACIPASKENREALDQFAAGIDRMRDTLAAYLKPENIETTLKTLGTVSFMLPAPQPEVDGD